MNGSSAAPSGLLRPYHGRLTIIYRVVDAFLVMFTLYISTRVMGVNWHDRYSFIAVTAVIILQMFAGRNDLYRSWRFSHLKSELTQLWLAWAGTVVSLLMITFALKTTENYSRLVLTTWFLSVPVVFGIWRFIVRSALYELRRKGYNSRSVAILGANELGSNLAMTIHNAGWMGLRFAGFYDDRKLHKDRLDEKASCALHGDLEHLVEKVHQGEIDIVYITFPMRAEPRVNAVINRLSDTTATVYYVPDFNVFDMLSGRWLSIGEFPIVSINESPHTGIDGTIKRIEDIVLGSMILMMILIPMIFIALAIKITSPGPVLFKQRRYGIDGREIWIWKFRTMTVCEDGHVIKQATQNDCRVTPLGNFLRRTSLDELPQFFNVLQGQMSIVGPRPHAVAHNEEYRKLINRYMLRHKVKPGITGLAQVNGWRGETDTLEKMAKRVEYDLNYIKNWTLLLDLKLIVMTVFKGFSHKNAY